MKSRQLDPRHEQAEFRARVSMGWQCPECFGVRISIRRYSSDPVPIGWECLECGCNWSKEVIDQ